MKRPDIQIVLYGPSGDKENWTIRFMPIKKRMGQTDWVNRIVTINSRLRNKERIRDTLLHEILHVTSGQNGSEYLVANSELNFSKAMKVLGL
jgi:Zn-dependent peptidase ImmA (M78 family)